MHGDNVSQAQIPSQSWEHELSLGTVNHNTKYLPASLNNWGPLENNQF